MKIKNPLFKVAICLTVISFVCTLFLYQSLPEQIPTHFNMAGEVDAYGSRPFSLITASLPLFMLALLYFVPRIDPKKQAYEKHSTAYHIFIFFMTLFLIGVHWSTILIALGFSFSIEKFILIGIGILFLVLGNYMPQVRLNYTFGFKLPWTLNSEKNWRATHRIGGYCYIVGGLLSIVAAFFSSPLNVILFITVVLITFIIPTLYSYWYFKKKETV